MAAFLEAIDAGEHNHVAGVQAGCDLGLLAVIHAESDIALRDGVVGLDEEDVGLGGGALDGGVVEENHAGLLLYQQAYVHELIGEEGVVLVVKDGAKTEGTGALIDFVVDGGERAGGDFDLGVFVERVDRELFAGVHAADYGLQLALREREDDADGIDLGDHDEIG